MNCREVREHIIDHEAGAAECPLCKEHMANCPECAKEARILAELSRAFERVGSATRHPRGEQFESHLVRACAAFMPFAQNRWADRRFLNKALAAAAVLLLAFGAVIAMFSNPTTNDAANLSTELLGLDDTAAAVSRTLGVQLVITPDARKAAFARTACLEIESASAEEAVEAVALAFGLSASKWGESFVLEDRAVAVVRSLGDAPREPVRMDLSIALKPEELSLFDNIAGRLVAVEDISLSTSVAKNARLPFVKDDSDVTIAKRPDETFEVRRSLPWLYVDPNNGKLEFMSLSDDDMARFNTLRDVLRAISSGGDRAVAQASPFPAALLEPLKAREFRTLGDLVRAISRETGMSAVMGSGVDPRLSLPASVPGAASRAEALDLASAGRSFYFTVVGDCLLVDEVALLQRHLEVIAIRVPTGESAAAWDLVLQSVWSRWFPQDPRLGAMTAVFRDYVLVRHHLYPLHMIASAPTGKQ